MLIALTRPPQAARMPSADLVAVVVHRGEDGVLCISYQLSGLIRLGSEFALEIRREVAGGTHVRTLVSGQGWLEDLEFDGRGAITERAIGGRAENLSVGAQLPAPSDHAIPRHRGVR